MERTNGGINQDALPSKAADGSRRGRGYSQPVEKGRGSSSGSHKAAPRAIKCVRDGGGARKDKGAKEVVAAKDKCARAKDDWGPLTQE